MDSITDLPGKQPMDGTMLARSVKHQDAPVVPARRIVGFTLWVLGFLTYE